MSEPAANVWLPPNWSVVPAEVAKSLVCDPLLLSWSTPPVTLVVPALLNGSAVLLVANDRVPAPCLVKLAPGLLLNALGAPPVGVPAAGRAPALLAMKVPLLL